MKSILRHVVALYLLVYPVMADDTGDAGDVVREMVDRVLVILRNKELAQRTKRDRVMQAVNSVFDFPLMARLALGRKCWVRLNGKQRKEFTHLFVKQLQGSYLDKVELYSDEEVEVGPPVQVKSKFIDVRTYVVSRDERIAIKYRLHYGSDGWKAYDVEVQGVSIVKTCGSQCRQVLRDGGVVNLLTKMREKARYPGGARLCRQQR